MAKRVQVSVDGGSTYRTLPGSSGEMRRELATLNDTIFGQTFQSEDVSIGTWTVSANSIHKGVAGYLVKIMEGGTPTALSAEAMSLVTGKTYQVTDTTKRVFHYATPLQVFDNAVDHTADVASIDYLAGTVTFDAGYTVTGPVTVTGNYMPMSQMAKGRSFGLTQTAAEIDTTTYEVAQANGGWRTLEPGLRTVSMEVGGLFDQADDVQAALVARGLLYVSVQLDGNQTSVFRGFFKRTSQSQSGEVGALEEQSLQLNLFVPDGDLVETPFGWYFTGATIMNQAVRDVLGAWQNEELVKVRYLPDGEEGYEGDAMVAEASVANTFEGLNEFSITFRGSGTPAEYTP